MNARMFASAFAASAVVLVTNAVAVNTPCPNPYIVQLGDNLSSLAEVKLQDSRKWVELEKQNPILQDRARYWTDSQGRQIVLIRPGETLCGLEAAGINPIDFWRPRPDTLRDLPAPQPSVEIPSLPNQEIQNDKWSWWGWLLLAMSALLLLASLGQWMTTREKRKLESERARRAVNNDPAAAGPPMVSGGVSEETADQALREMSARRFGGAHQDFTILERTAGRVYGTMLVGYRDNTEQPWVMSGQRAYQARIRRPNGHEEVIYMLQACGNDLRFGEVAGYRIGDDFRFEADQVVQTPDEPIAEASVIPEPPPVSETVEAQLVEVPAPGTIKVELRPGDGNMPNLISVSGINPVGATIELTATSFKLRYAELAQPRD